MTLRALAVWSLLLILVILAVLNGGARDTWYSGAALLTSAAAVRP